MFLHLWKRKSGMSENFGHSYSAAQLNMFLFKQDFGTEISHWGKKSKPEGKLSSNISGFILQKNHNGKLRLLPWKAAAAIWNTSAMSVPVCNHQVDAILSWGIMWILNAEMPHTCPITTGQRTCFPSVVSAQGGLMPSLSQILPTQHMTKTDSTFILPSDAI